MDNNSVLKQRGRAEVDFLASLLTGSADVRKAAERDIRRVAGIVDALPNDLDQCNQMMEAGLRDSKAFRVQELYSEWYAVNHGRVAVEAFDEMRPDIQGQLDHLSEGPTKVEADLDFVAPAYWEGVEFHRTYQAWDGHPYMGFVHAEIVHRHMVGKLFPDGIFQQRKRVAEMAPCESYARILDMGCSTGYFTLALAETYPEANITGIDLSVKTLEQAQRVANERQLHWHLLQRKAEATDFDSNGFDLVGSYILLHEIPASILKQVFAEAFRVLKPGGDLLMSDAPRYGDLDKLARWRADRGAMYGGEPFWRETASLDLAEVAREAGFVDVSAGGVDGANYPYVVQGRKPE